MELEITEIANGRCEATAFGKVTRRMPILLHPILLRRKIDHCTKEQRGRERMFPRKRVRRR
jgi:hypothetical protein